MKKFKKLIIFLVVTLLLAGGGALGYFKIYIPMQEEWKVILKDTDSNQIESLNVMRNSIIEIYDSNNKVKEEIIVKDEKEFTIKDQNDTDTKIFVEYEINKLTGEDIKKPSYKLTPKYQDKKDFTITVFSDSKSKISMNGKKYRKKTITVDSEVTFEDTLPDIILETNYKGDWKLADDTIINLEDIITSDQNIQFKTYQDKNDNGIDDFTEKFTVNYVTSVEETIDSVVVGWEETIKLPELKHDEKIFYEWYSDKEMKTVITEKTKITADTTVYAKFKDYKTVMNESVEKPITRKDLAIQVERILNDYNDKVDNEYNEAILGEVLLREVRDQAEKEQNIFKERSTTTELSNKAHNKLYFITFLDKNNEFIYGFVSPYGRTIKVFDTTNNLKKEYAVRQDTTIILNEDILTSYNEELVNFASEYYRINDTVYVKITPTVKVAVVEESTQE